MFNALIVINEIKDSFSYTHDEDADLGDEYTGDADDLGDPRDDPPDDGDEGDAAADDAPADDPPADEAPPPDETPGDEAPPDEEPPPAEEGEEAPPGEEVPPGDEAPPGEGGPPEEKVPGDAEEEEEEEEEECPKLCDYMMVARDICVMEVHAQEPWPQDVKLFQPYEVEQILLPDNANCLAVQAFLKMCNLEFEVEPRSNAEYMSPSGRVPFIKCGAFVVAELDPIISFVNSKSISLSDKLDNAQKADMRAYMSLVNTVLGNAELYVTWCDKATLQEVTKPRFGSVHPWPLNHVITWQKRAQVVKKLGVLGWGSKTLDEVYKEVENCCSALSERLESRAYFFGDSPTELDAVVFGHLFSILTTPLPLPNNQVATIVRSHRKLVDFVKQIDSKYFGRNTEVSKDNIVQPVEPPPPPPPAEGGGEVEPTGEEGSPETEPPEAGEEPEPPEEPAEPPAEEAEPPAEEAEPPAEEAEEEGEGAEEEQ